MKPTKAQLMDLGAAIFQFGTVMFWVWAICTIYDEFMKTQ